MMQPKRRAYTEQTFDHLKGLDGISDDQISEHLGLYAGYVTQVNALNDELAELRGHGRASGKDHEFAELTRRLGFEYNGMILHEYYFSIDDLGDGGRDHLLPARVSLLDPGEGVRSCFETRSPTSGRHRVRTAPAGR
jgi:hypothetical protein